MDAHAQIQRMVVAEAQADARAQFIRRTYIHLAAAIALFIGLEALLLRSPLAEAMVRFIQASRFSWLMVLGAFILVGWMARGLAAGVKSVPAQYAGLALFVVAEAVIFVPILYIAAHFSSPDVIKNAAVLTGLLFGGLTAVAFTTRIDFSFLRGILTIGFFIAMGLIVCSIFIGFNLGLLFAALMVVIAAGAILYDTSKIIHHYHTDQHVAASLELFASIALMFWYILQLVMAYSRD